jgi:hypothetical protein
VGILQHIGEILVREGRTELAVQPPQMLRVVARQAGERRVG